MQSFFRKFYKLFLRINALRNLISFTKAFFYLKILRKKPKIYNGNKENISSKTISSNMRVVHEEGKLPEHPTERFLFNIGLNQGNPKSDMIIEPVNSVLSSKLIPKERVKVLSIGPRSLGEILNIQSHGYEYKNISAIDLFSISSKINIGDIHNIPYEDDKFDVIFCGWVIAYSENKKLACSEIVRVLKPGGIFSIGVSYSPITNEEQIKKRGYLIGTKDRIINTQEIKDLFENSINQIYFETNPENKDLHSQIILTGSVK
ncbi:MAG: hypothetical protein CMM98_02125 [Rickettsiales bacterium]|nr:hypothetical protein [Rickettsiales bacterium]|tara:strand:- start:437 stop:1219 length:783 start_codon:yes stop_codon:yes gene_type:complete